jgi:hypothetical protein
VRGDVKNMNKKSLYKFIRERGILKGPVTEAECASVPRECGDCTYADITTDTGDNDDIVCGYPSIIKRQRPRKMRACKHFEL